MSNLDIKFKRLTPFKRCVLQNFPFIEADFDALTNYGLLCKIVEYLNQVIASQNEVQVVTEEIVTAFNNLYDYVKNYFDNLDIQDEINNKLDEMAADGSLGELLYNALNKDVPLGNLKLKNIRSINQSTTDLYESQPHAWSQGFCYINGNVVVAFRNTEYLDNYVRLDEYNLETGSKIRETYLELGHANSLSYKSSTNEIYVAELSVSNDGNPEYSNRVFILDYTDLTIKNTVTIGNIPDGHRIRSVYYDNDNNILYAGDSHDVFVIDESNFNVSETINLNTDFIDTNVTNQTIKRYHNYFIGIYFKFIGIWTLDGELIRVIPLEQTQGYEHLGEVEDFAFDDNENMIISSCRRMSPRLDYFTTDFYKTNLTKNTENVFGVEIGSADTTAIWIYVDSESLETEEDGTSAYPFKNLQRAVNFANRTGQICQLSIATGSYDYTFIQGNSKLLMKIAGTVTIDGLEVAQSNVIIWNDTDCVLTLNGISEHASTIDFEPNGDDKLIITPKTKQSVTGSGYCIYARSGNITVDRATVTGSDGGNLCYFTDKAVASISSTTFDGYEGYYAIRATNDSIVVTRNNTYSETISNSQHNILVENGAVFYSRKALADKNNVTLQSTGKIFPSVAEVTPSHTYYGELCDLDYSYSHVLLELKTAGGSDMKQTRLFNIDKMNGALIDNTWPGSSGMRYGAIKLSVTNDKLSITASRTLWWPFEGTPEYVSNTSDTPSNVNNFIGVEKVVFCNL